MGGRLSSSGVEYSAHMAAHTEDVNCGPLSDEMVEGTPNLATHPVNRASAQPAVDVSARGIASTQRVVRSMTVSRCVWPLLAVDRGPTRST